MTVRLFLSNPPFIELPDELTLFPSPPRFPHHLPLFTSAALLRLTLFVSSTGWGLIAGLIAFFLCSSQLDAHAGGYAPTLALLCYAVPMYTVKCCHDVLSDAVDALFVCTHLDAENQLSHCPKAVEAVRLLFSFPSFLPSSRKLSADVLLLPRTVWQTRSRIPLFVRVEFPLPFLPCSPPYPPVQYSSLPFPRPLLPPYSSSFRTVRLLALSIRFRRVVIYALVLPSLFSWIGSSGGEKGERCYWGRKRDARVCEDAMENETENEARRVKTGGEEDRCRDCTKERNRKGNQRCRVCGREKGKGIV